MLGLIEMRVKAEVMAGQRFGDELNLADMFAEVQQNVEDGIEGWAVIALNGSAQHQRFGSLGGHHFARLLDSVFVLGTALSIVMVLIYTHLWPVALPVLVIVNAVMFLGIFSRMIPFQAMMVSVPSPAQRGAFNAISASIQQLSGGIASVVAGHIVALAADGKLQHFDRIGWVVVAASLVSLTLLWRLQSSRAAG